MKTVETVLHQRGVFRDTILRRGMETHWRNVLRARAQAGHKGQAMIHSSINMIVADGQATITSTFTEPEIVNV